MQNVHHCFAYSDTPDVWILTTPATAPLNTVTLICPEKPMETIQIQHPIHILKLPTACSATSSHFYLPPRYETPMLDVNVSLNMANLQMVNISAQCFHLWQHLGNNKVTYSFNTWQPYPQFLSTGFTNISSIAPCPLYPLILIHQRIQIPFGIYSPTQEYMYQL